MEVIFVWILEAFFLRTRYMRVWKWNGQHINLLMSALIRVTIRITLTLSHYSVTTFSTKANANWLKQLATLRTANGCSRNVHIVDKINEEGKSFIRHTVLEICVLSNLESFHEDQRPVTNTVFQRQVVPTTNQRFRTKSRTNSHINYVCVCVCV